MKMNITEIFVKSFICKDKSTKCTVFSKFGHLKRAASRCFIWLPERQSCQIIEIFFPAFPSMLKPF